MQEVLADNRKIVGGDSRQLIYVPMPEKGGATSAGARAAAAAGHAAHRPINHRARATRRRADAHASDRPRGGDPMRFSLWIAAGRGGAARAARLGLRRQRRPDRDRAQPRPRRRAATSGPACTSSGRWSKRARVRPPPAGARCRAGALPHLREARTSASTSSRWRMIQDVRAFYRATGGDEVARGRSAWRRSSRIRCATRSTPARCSRWCRAIALEVIGTPARRRSTTARRRWACASSTCASSASTCRPTARSSGRLRPHARAAPAGRQRSCVPKAPSRPRPIRAQADRDKAGDRGRGRARRAAAARRRRCRGRARPTPPAANKDPGFYAFQRSLEAYRKSFADGEAVIVLERDDPFLQYFKSRPLTGRCTR